VEGRQVLKNITRVGDHYRATLVTTLGGEIVEIRGWAWWPQNDIIRFPSGKDGGKVVPLVSRTTTLENAVRELFRWQTKGFEERLLDEAYTMYAQSPYNCRRIFPTLYRSVTIVYHGLEREFEGLPEGRLWPDRLLLKMLEEHGQSDRATAMEEQKFDLVNGVISHGDAERLVELMEEKG
jgi:hypothetical protein